MKFTPYPEQHAAIDDAVEFLRAAKSGDRRLYSGPTGSGKSVVELAVQEEFDDSWIVAPREEICGGMLQKLGELGNEYNDAQLESAMWGNRIVTPIRLRNRLLSGSMDAPGKLIIDEAHHDAAETWRQLALLASMCPAVGYTATAFRGSPQSTRKLLEIWGEAVPIITYPEAEQLGRITMPTYTMLPLVDDDVIDVENGEFSVTSTESIYSDRLDELVSQAFSRGWIAGSMWSRPTIFSLPSSGLCRALASRFLDSDALVCVVSADTPKSERRKAFDLVVQRKAAIAHVNIVTEGVDLPLRRLVDLSPVMSPVKWLQQLGRITRPTDERPEYVCTNRNLLRHAYLLEGVLPPRAVAEAEEAFGFSERGAGGRVIGLECIGRFKPTTIKTLSGVTCALYNLSTVCEDSVVEYACFVHPAMKPLWAIKLNSVKDGVRSCGKWAACPAPAELRGFQSAPPSPLTDKQKAWWNRSAAQRGLDPKQEVTRKNFAALPLLTNLGAVVR